jgi:hypothetical protein
LGRPLLGLDSATSIVFGTRVHLNRQLGIRSVFSGKLTTVEDRSALCDPV